MRTHIKIVYGICLTASFITLIVMISIIDLVGGVSVGIDIGAFTIYSTAMHQTATARVRERRRKSEKDHK